MAERSNQARGDVESYDAKTVFTLVKNDPKVDELRPKHASAFQDGVSAKGTLGQLIVEIRDDGSAFLWQTMPADVAAVMPTGIVYRLFQSVEKFSIGSGEVVVEKVIEGIVSQFIVDNFADLKEALIAYRDSLVVGSNPAELPTSPTSATGAR